MPDTDRVYDLLIVGAGINGAGIARDAAGRGLSVAICDKGDIAGATSWTSSKLIHGGLRYLAKMEFSLVRESLMEREVLLRIVPHLTTPLRFVMPSSRGGFTTWLMRTGLWLYDHLGGVRTLAASATVTFSTSAYGLPLKEAYQRGFVYSDVQVDDARLTLANVQDASAKGATILARTCLIAARRETGIWIATLASQTGGTSTLRSRAIINAGGPWAAHIHRMLGGQEPVNIQLVRGSHIVVPRLYDGNHAYTLHNDDGRIVFLIPYHERYTLIGTTEVKMSDPDSIAEASTAEINYLCTATNRYLRQSISSADVIWQFAGVRPLLDDGNDQASRISREYRFILDQPAANQAPLLTIIGGKLTTYRRLAEKALVKLAPMFPTMGASWTAKAILPGRLINSADDAGRHFGAGLYERDVRYFIAHEWAHDADDILWRRTKAGLSMTAEQRHEFAEWLERNR